MPIDLRGFGQRLFLIAVISASLTYWGALNIGVEAASVKQVGGGGTSGSITCPDGTSEDVVGWNVNFNKNKGVLVGTIGAFSGGFGFATANLNSGTITESKFAASGIGNNSFCNDITPPAHFTVQGRCGDDVTVQLKIDDIRGTLRGSVACSN